jgi:hypothetical protein
VPDDIPVRLKIFPPYVEKPNGLDLDLSGLTLADKVVIDQFAYDYVCSSYNFFLAPMAASLRLLRSKGQLSIEDYSTHQSSFESDLLRWVDDQLEYPERWLPTIRAQYTEQLPSVYQQLKFISKNPNVEIETLPFGVLSVLRLSSSKISGGQIAALLKLFNSRYSRYSNDERAILRELVRPYLTQTATDILLGRKLRIPFVPWSADSVLYQKMVGPNIVRPDMAGISIEDLDDCQKLFFQVISHLQPLSVFETEEFKRDKAAQLSLLRALRSAQGAGKRIDDAAIHRIKDEIIEFEARLKRRSTLLSLVLGAGTLPTAVATPLISIIVNLLSLTVNYG